MAGIKYDTGEMCIRDRKYLEGLSLCTDEMGNTEDGTGG